MLTMLQSKRDQASERSERADERRLDLGEVQPERAFTFIYCTKLYIFEIVRFCAIL